MNNGRTSQAEVGVHRYAEGEEASGFAEKDGSDHCHSIQGRCNWPSLGAERAQLTIFAGDGHAVSAGRIGFSGAEECKSGAANEHGEEEGAATSLSSVCRARLELFVRQGETQSKKQEIDNTNLVLYNLNYEKNHFTKQIRNCRDFRGTYSTIDLVSVETFKSSAPAELSSVDSSKLCRHGLIPVS